MDEAATEVANQPNQSADRRSAIAYLRVSTKRQSVSGLGIGAQAVIVADYMNAHRFDWLATYREAESGKKNDRPALASALAHCKQVGAKLVIARLDRLARNVAFIANLMDKDVDFVACDLPDATPFMLHIYAAVAQEEGRRISERIKNALAVARSRGTRLGAPVEVLRREAARRHKDAVARAQEAAEIDAARKPVQGETVRAYAARMGVSVSTAWKKRQLMAEC